MRTSDGYDICGQCGVMLPCQAHPRAEPMTPTQSVSLRQRALDIADECMDLVSFHRGIDGGPATIRAASDDTKALEEAAQMIRELVGAIPPRDTQSVSLNGFESMTPTPRDTNEEEEDLARMETPNDPTDILTAPTVSASSPLVQALRVLIARDRETADIWERQNHDYWPKTPREDVARPPDRGRGAIANWINWLRNRADELERLCLE